MLSITNLSKRYTTKTRLSKDQRLIKALDGVSLDLSPGMFGLLGPNGAGKSSLMRTIATLQQPDAGSMHFAGEDVLANPTFMRQRLGYLPQEFGVYPGVSTHELLDYLAKLKGVNDPGKRLRQIDKLLEQVNLSEHKHRPVSQFSGGMKQRFGIAQALLGEPEILVVDEPTAGLDPEERNRFHNLLAEISADKVVLLSTHIVEDVSHLCPDMAILANGRVIKRGAPRQLTNEVENKVWQVTVKPEDLHEVSTSCQVLSQRMYAGEITLHVFSETQPGDGFTPVIPDLEDAYFAALHQASQVELLHG